MTKQQKRFKGDCMMCAIWIRGDGMATRLPGRDRRRLGGRTRRIARSVRHSYQTLDGPIDAAS